MIVSIHALFSHNNLIGSKIISKGSRHLDRRIKTAPSHTALLVNNRWVHESTGHSGVRVISYDVWKQINTEIDRIQLKSREYQEIANLYRAIQDKKYDYPGVIFLGMCVAGTFIHIKLPEKNLCESENKYFCCEVLGKLTGHYYGMSAPVQILGKLKYG